MSMKTARFRTSLIGGLSALALVATSVAIATPSLAASGSPADTHRPPQTTSAVDVHLPVVREAAEGAPQYTVYRPADGKGRDAYPVVVWGNGACNHKTDVEFIASLSLLASHGFVVIAEGYYAGAPATGVPEGAQPSLLTGAIDWAEQADRRGLNSLRHRLDLDKVAIAGQSCGGIEALAAGDDPRAKAVLSLNSGLFPTPVLGYGREELAQITAPILFVDGGPTDVAYQNTIDNYALVTSPTIRVSNADAGHTGLWHNTRNNVADATITLEADVVLTQYLDFVLNGNAAAGAYFLGESPGITAVTPWTVESKGY
jgi:predicted alpha/beta-hydrolase family hydrolase